jgi:hypothetical protein
MKLVRAIVFIFLTMIGSLVMAQPNSPDQPVGKVIFATGSAYANQVAMQSGSPIYVGQTLSTAGNGHLHIRMIDGAFISLRPSSSAKVAVYTIDLEEPANTHIRIDVQHGVVRSVTGKGGEKNHSAFRLNTPVAAIGIRGTDFIVYTDAISSVVDLRQGGIEMTPFSDTCSPMGTCAGHDSVTLIDRNPGLLAEVHAAQQKASRVNKVSAAVVPDKVEPAHPAESNSLKQAKEEPIVISSTPAAEVRTTGTSPVDGKKEASANTVVGSSQSSNTGAVAPASATVAGGKTGGTAASMVNESVNGSESVTSASTVKTPVSAAPSVASPTTLVSASSSSLAAASVGATVDVASIAPVTSDVGPKGSVTSELASRVISQATTDGSIKAVEKEITAVAVPTPIPALVSAVPSVDAKAQPFYWGRWTSYAENAEQNIVRDPARNKQVFAANTVMLLASKENSAPTLPKSGVVNFKQDKAEAHLLQGGALYDARVSNPALAINFDQNNFTTSLDVSSTQLISGTEHLRATGTLDANTGTLRSSGAADSNMTISGDVSDAASHAAYLFNQDKTGIVGAISWVQ